MQIGASDAAVTGVDKDGEPGQLRMLQVMCLYFQVQQTRLEMSFWRHRRRDFRSSSLTKAVPVKI